MLFYSAEGTIVNYDAEANHSRVTQRSAARKILISSENFNEKLSRDSFYFVSDIYEGTLTIGIITETTYNLEKNLNSYLKYLNYELEDVVIDEITINGIHHLLSTADRSGFVSECTEISERFNLDKVVGRRGVGIEYGENIIEDRSRSRVFSNAEKYLMKETFWPELERIYACNTATKVQGHPVHYIFQTDDRDTRREAYKTLLQALYANNRLRSRRYCYLDFKPGENFSLMSYDALYRLCSGGAVVVRYLTNDNCNDGDHASNESFLIESLCEVAKRYRNQVLTIICLPRECKNTKALFYENLGTMSFVEIQEDFVSGDKARDFLKMLARENHIRTDKNLFAKIELDKSYLAPELRELFNDWYNDKLKTTVYPQYKELHSAKREVIKAAPRGSAYDTLQEMVGLKEAKAVIQKALNFYKIQKLYEDKGLKVDTPAMHMVFTGNPGTAKTTVARLFARIMKDNGLLSKGQLIEVGRGDLVGKFVGWTAQTVQSKFKAAIGGVLFIDEAYSLVDDRAGSFGDEAINTIVQEMENHREDVVVIFAGYPDKMEAFLQKNPGLRSRIAFHVPFADYDAQELCEIASLIGKSKGVIIEDEALEKLVKLFEIARKQSDFGNGRYARNVIEQAKMNQASRLLEYDFDDITTEEITTIRAADILIPSIKLEEHKRIGFAS